MNKRAVRGDTALSCYVLVLVACFTALHVSDSFRDDAGVLTAKLAAVYLLSALATTAIYRLSPFHPLAQYPGPRGWHISSIYLTFVSAMGKRHLQLHELHARYGSVIRIGKYPR